MTNVDRPNRWWKALLIGSVALNLFLGGLVVGRFIQAPWGLFAGRPDIGLDMIVARLTASMSETDQRVVKGAVDKHRAAIITKLEAARVAKARVKDTVRDEHLTSESLQSSLADVVVTSDAVRAELMSLVLETAPALSPDGRKKAVALLDARRGPGGPPWMR
jgi:uncharacterized membrane protein